MEATLKVPAQNVIAMMVDRAIFPPCGTDVPSTTESTEGTSTFEPTEFSTTVIDEVTTENDLMSTEADIMTTDMSSTIQSSENEQLLMIVGGFDIEGPANGNKVNLVSLDPDFPVPECLLNLNDFPKFLLDACSATLTGNLPHVCTGLDGYEGPIDKCYRYVSGSDTWLEWGTLSEARHRAGCSQCDEHGLVIIGGQAYPNNGDYTNLVESTQNGQTITLLEDLPESKQYPCVVALQAGNIFCAGGSYANPNSEKSGKTHIFRMENPETSKWTEVADMITPTDGHVCGAIFVQGGSQEVVAAGGRTGIASPSDAVQIYSVDDDMWRSANPLPFAMYGATSVPYEDSFLLLGGAILTGYSDAILRYRPQTESWTLLDTKMPRAAYGMTAVMVKRDIFPECEVITTEANMASTGAPLPDMLIMVIGGKTITWDPISDTELVSPYPSSNPLPECLVDLKPFTYGAIKDSVGAAVAPDGLPLMCGGSIMECDGEGGCSSQVTDKCWVYDPLEDGWKETAGTMAAAKGDHTADYTESFGLAMVNVEDPLEVTRDGGLSFVELAGYPNSDVTLSDAGCLVVVDDQTLFLAGGDSYLSGSDRAFLYDVSSDSWTEIPSMRVGRRFHSCGIDSTKEEIVVAGGVDDASPLSSVEIFTVATMSWRDGNSLPFALAGSYATRFGDTLVLTGGYTYNLSDLSDSLIMYDTTSGTWVELEGKLKTPRRLHVAIAVEKSIFPQCE